MIWALALIALALLIAALASAGSGGTIVVGDVPIEVEQGPEALAALLYDPPLWAAPVVLAGCVAVVGAAYAGYRRHGLDDEVKAEMLGNLLVVGSIAGVTVVMSSVDVAPYWVDVAAGVVVGFPLALIAQDGLGL